MGESADRTALLKRWALAAGFDRVGVTRLAPSAFSDFFDEWLAAGHNASMDWLARRRDVRRDPRQLLDGAESAVCVALHYAPLEDAQPPGEVLDRVARYARGDDYHDVMTIRLRALCQLIEDTFPGARARSWVDTGPILERELAARAGLGYIGKNTNLISREGSWFLLGEVLTTLTLEPDDPISDLCGRCTRCLDACPTGALLDAYVLDSRRCISYWTIEHRGDHPPELAGSFGEWMFGCDICQEVCPWNWPGEERLEDRDHPELEASPARLRTTIEEMVEIDREDYVKRFRRSPMKRSKQQGLQRNARTVSENRCRTT